jgi:tetratricopeptide (TPR) repeat protein
VTPPARIAEFWYLLKARIALFAGQRHRARTALKAALRRNPSSFMAHFMLGRLYWRDRSIVKAKREFDLSWQIDPERFERAYTRLRDLQEGAPELLAYPPDPQEVPVTARSRGHVYYGDFMNEAERERFDSMPPITREEIHQIDWDSFYRDL